MAKNKKRWTVTGDDVTNKLTEMLDSDMNQVVINSAEIVDALKACMTELGDLAVAFEAHGGMNQAEVEGFKCYYMGAIAGMTNLIGCMGVYSPDKCHELQRLFLEGGAQ